MIRISAPEPGRILLACTRCVWASNWAVIPSIGIEKLINDALFHAQDAHGIDEIRGPMIENDR